ncbi:ABC transporter permease [Actinomycetospora flava]|uniref:ABC transporter permease n=1 Tax=Actinomycetospora flava TaxID=3129232 RepID=A0ABU8MC85_9PSEU
MTEPLTTAPPPTAAEAAPSAGAEATRGLWADGWNDLRRRPRFWIAAALIVLLLLMAVVPSLFTSVDPTVGLLERSRLPPGPGGIFGTDLQGRDVYARTIYGAAPSLAVGFLATFGTVVVGSLAGLLAGYAQGWTDSLLSRVGEIFAGLPFILGGIVILTSFNRPGEIVGAGQLVFQVVLTIVVLTWPVAMRIMRAAAIETSQQDYVKAAKALGAGPFRVVLRHILPNTLAPVLVYGAIQFGVFIGAEATLSFLGIGLRDPVVSWGVMISEARDRVQDIPWALFFPAGFLVITVLAFVMMGDAVRDALDPRGR